MKEGNTRPGVGKRAASLPEAACVLFGGSVLWIVCINSSSRTPFSRDQLPQQGQMCREALFFLVDLTGFSYLN